MSFPSQYYHYVTDMTTINDIARLTGVSKSTISRVMTNPSIVKKTTRDKVLEIIKSQNYVPSNIAQNLSGTSSKNIGIVIDELANCFFIEILEGVEKILSEQDYSLQIYSSQWIAEKEVSQIRSLISKRVSGIMLAPLGKSGPAIDMAMQSNIPIVVINCIPDNPKCEYVSCDNIFGGSLVGKHFNEIKAEQNIIITGFDHQTINHRVQGFLQTVREPEKVIRYCSVSTFDEGRKLAPVLVSKNHINQRRTSIFVTNDNVAIGLMDSLINMGIDIPNQVSIIGFDDILISSLCKIPLSTVSQHAKMLGSIAAKNLLDMINNKKHVPCNTLIKPELILRNS
ncbi:MAG: LacI family DNA-binding transcriptional regulator [Sphaerochaetaceae bacterium]